MIPFNKPYLTGKELEYIKDAVNSGKISGNGNYTRLCQDYFEKRYGLKKCLLTTSCTDALEMASILCNVKLGDEVICPSFTFVSSALAFVRQGAKIVFADSKINHPGIDEDKIEELINEKTKVIVVVHYAGVSCNMNKIMDIAQKHSLYVVEDAAQSIDSYFINNEGERKLLGTIGHLGTFSFHETKNIQCGEGGMLCINDESFIKRSEIIWEKGTNRIEFFRGEVNKYGWVDIGSSFLPSEINAAFLYAQLENLDNIQNKRKLLWNKYYDILSHFKTDNFKLPHIPNYSTNNAHMFYLVCKDSNTRTYLIEKLKEKNIQAVFHYQSLHKSPYYFYKHDGRLLKNSDYFSECLVRLPLYYEMEVSDVEKICEILIKVNT